MVRVLLANCLGIGRWGTPLINGLVLMQVDASERLGQVSLQDVIGHRRGIPTKLVYTRLS
jgi:hypothetical protein